MEEMNQNVMPGFGWVLWTVVIGLTIAGIYIVLKKLFLPTIASGWNQQKILARVTYGEKLFWPVLVVAIGISLILSHTIVGLALGVFLAGVFWKSINNYFWGLIYLAGKSYTVGQRIRYNDYQGTIKAFHNISLEMELEDGESLHIPYNFFADTTIIKTSPLSGVVSHALTLSISKPNDLSKERQRIKALLLGLPWILPNQKIIFEQLAEDENHYLLKIVIHGIDKDHLFNVENKIRSMYSSHAS